MDLPVNDAALLDRPRTGPTRALAAFVAELRLDEVDEVARHAAPRHLIDTLGAMIAGAPQQATGAVERALDAAGVPPGPLPVPGLARRRDMLSAAYIGGTAAHGLELDDGYRPGSVHPGAVVVPPVLALGAMRHASGAAVLRAVIAGYEATCRIAAASHPRARWRGFHNTGTAGVFGAATAAAALLDFDADAVENAIGVAASSAAGLFTFLAGGDVKRTHPGHAAREGLMAALLTESGLAAPRGALEFREGYFNAYAGGDAGAMDAAAIDLLAAGGPSPRSRFAVAGCYIKPHACCRHIHAAIDAALDILRSEGVTAAQVERVEIGTYAVAAAHAAVGWTEMTTAQMSFPFVIATALHRGRVGLSDFGAGERADPSVLEVTGRVHVSVDPGCEADYPRLRAARLLLVTRDGRRLERYVPEPLGGIRNPLDDAGIGDKFLGLAGPVLGAARAEAALAQLWRVDELPDIAPLAESLARA